MEDIQKYFKQPKCLNSKTFALGFFIIFYQLLWSDNDNWNDKITYKEIIQKAQQITLLPRALGIYLRSGEGGSVINTDLSAKWSEAADSKGHPFGAYNLANLAMLEGDLEKATNLYQDAAFKLQRLASDGDPVALYCMGEIDFQVIPTNVQRALDLFKRSAKKGFRNKKQLLVLFI